MASGDNRHAKPTGRFDSHQVAQLTRPAEGADPVDELADAFEEWDGNPVADGTASRETRDSTPLVSRTATVHDPMTTGLLAEASRVTHTVELSPEQIEEAHRALPTIPEEPAPASPRLIRRVTRNPR
jgi:hypothetical protein